MKDFLSVNPKNRNNHSDKLLFQIKQVDDKDEKLEIMKKCDCSFTKGVTNRSDFSELFDKIHKNAVFLSVKYNENDIRDTDVVVGYAAIYVNDIKTFSAYITLICISPKYQRLHLGSELIMECFSKAQLAGMKQIRLEVLKRDIHAIKFYEAHGFKQESNASEQSYYMCKVF